MAEVPSEAGPELAQALSAGLAALRAGQFEQAAGILQRVCAHPEFVAAADLKDVRSRAESLCAEALLLAGRPDEALPHAEVALGLARQLGDIEGTDEIERLRARIHRSNASGLSRAPEQDHLLLDKSPEELANQAPHPMILVDLLVRKATVELEVGRTEAARLSATAALATLQKPGAGPPQPRLAVLARLLLARAEPERAGTLLQEAAELARAAQDFNLTAWVARSAELLGIQVE